MTPAASDRSFRPDIQGMRALAVLAVVANHAGLPFATGGFVGVDVFFVISGYLITAQLVREHGATGRVRFAAFYGRRARRILPASFAVLAATVVAAMLCVAPALRPQVLSDAIATALYVPNLAFAAQQTDYLANTTPSVLQHYWSLGVEEQFYLVWPALLVAVLALAGWIVRRTGRRMPAPAPAVRLTVLVVMSVLLLASVIACVVQTSTDQPLAFFSPWTRAWEFGAGALAALAVREGADLVRPPSRLRETCTAVLAWAGLAVIVGCCVLYTATTVFPGIAVVAPVLGAVAMIAGGRGAPRFGPNRMLALPPVLFVGAISYSLYLVHWPVLDLVQASVGYEHPLALWATTGLAVASVPVAWLLYRFVEEPSRRSRRSVAVRPRRTLIAALGSSALLVGACVLALTVTSATPLASDRIAASVAPSAPPVETAYVPANLTPDLQHATDDDPALYSDSCELDSKASAPHPCRFGSGEQTIALFGDSHAAQWFPALRRVAAGAGYSLVTQTKSGCPAAAVEVDYKGAPYASCDAWRASVIAQLQADPPDVIVLADYVDPVFEHAGDEASQWEHGMRSTIDALAPHAKVVVLADTPDMGTSPVACLSAHLTSADACARRASTVLDSATRDAQKRTAAALGVPMIDLNDYLCGTSCPAIIGDTLVYRDSHHLTATFAAELAGPLGRRLAPLL
ncbi:acyltransferase family protein [Humibacter sp. RRB41]|uniref:acyltransferase family protein n=1 Tax=Humibacter sp. RRB41 TaxID=2919946 RepID=UPI001FAA60DA|nr:acyltransferase family protein [Humibacter sp. RRB41]